MTNTVRAGYVAALEALKAKGWINNYRVEGDSFLPEWTLDGAEQAKEELLKTKALGLKKSERGCLTLLLPLEKRREIDDVIVTTLKKQLDQRP